MILFLTWASLSVNSPQLPSARAVSPELYHTLQQQDSSVKRIPQNLGIEPSFRTNPLLRSLLNGQIDQSRLPAAIDSLLQVHPEWKGALLRELLVPNDPRALIVRPSPIARFQEDLNQHIKFTPFEIMSQIAKRYALYNSTDNSIKAYQIDIIGTIIWLHDILK
jgi:hypothetical protein